MQHLLRRVGALEVGAAVLGAEDVDRDVEGERHHRAVVVRLRLEQPVAHALRAQPAHLIQKEVERQRDQHHQRQVGDLEQLREPDVCQRLRADARLGGDAELALLGELEEHGRERPQVLVRVADDGGDLNCARVLVHKVIRHQLVDLRARL